MTRFLVIALVLTLVALATAANIPTCGLNARYGTISVDFEGFDDAELEDSASVAPRGFLKIALPTRGATGFEWTIDQVPSYLQVSCTKISPLSRLHGGNLVTIFYFNVLNNGNNIDDVTDDLVFNYARRWETDIPPARTAVVHVTLSGQGSANSLAKSSNIPTCGLNARFGTISVAFQGFDDAQLEESTRVAPRGFLKVSLPTRGATGFEWNVEQMPPFLQVSCTKIVPGRNMVTIFYFNVLNNGNNVNDVVEDLVLTYTRPWETGVAPARTATVHVTLAGQSSE